MHRFPSSGWRYHCRRCNNQAACFDNIFYIGNDHVSHNEDNRWFEITTYCIFHWGIFNIKIARTWALLADSMESLHIKIIFCGIVHNWLSRLWLQKGIIPSRPDHIILFRNKTRSSYKTRSAPNSCLISLSQPTEYLSCTTTFHYVTRFLFFSNCQRRRIHAGISK